jgi:hypothetical protein
MSDGIWLGSTEEAEACLRDRVILAGCAGNISKFEPIQEHRNGLGFRERDLATMSLIASTHARPLMIEVVLATAGIMRPRTICKLVGEA